MWPNRTWTPAETTPSLIEYQTASTLKKKAIGKVCLNPEMLMPFFVILPGILRFFSFFDTDVSKTGIPSLTNGRE
jgi:hypothetical protein